MGILSGLQPNDVFFYFEEICGIPHGSGNTQMISDYLVDFAKSHQLKYRQEACGNVIIWKDATPGYENADTVMLQGHMDMVAVQDEDCDLDMEKEGLRLAITDDGQWLYAKGTSLGGDDGIAVAYALAIFADDSIEHPALEAVFTVDEEIGLLGATALDASDLKSKVLLNMDSEEDGIFLTSCAGGATIHCHIPTPMENVEGILYDWKVDGLMGGHSGAEIHLGRISANLIFARFLLQVSKNAEFAVCSYMGGEKDNAIPNKCVARFLVQPEEAEKFEMAADAFASVLKKEYSLIEKNMTFHLSIAGQGETKVLTKEGKKNLTTALVHFPSGIQRMMPAIPDMVQTSLNLGILRQEEESMMACFSVRSAAATEKEWILSRVIDVVELLGGTYKINGSYTAWEYVENSRVQKLIQETYEELSGKPAKLTGIHAGVECGVFCEKLSGLDCISYGPGMRDIHTTRERLNIPSVKLNYEMTVRLLQKLK